MKNLHFRNRSLKPQWPNPQIWAEAHNQKSACTHLFVTSNALWNGMTQPISTNDYGGDTYLVHGLIGGQAKAVQTQGEVKWKSCISEKGLWIWFQGVYIMKCRLNLQFSWPPSRPNGITCKYKPRPTIKDPLSYDGPAHQMLSKMVCHIPEAQTAMEGIHF